MEFQLTEQMINDINQVKDERVERIAVPGQYRIWKSNPDEEIISVEIAPYDPI